MVHSGVSFVAAAAPHGEPSFDGLVRHYGQTQNKFIKAHHFLGPLSRYACFRHACLPIEILKFICVQFTARMEVIVVAQRGALICPDYKLTNLKNDIGKKFPRERNAPLEATSALHSWDSFE